MHAFIFGINTQGILSGGMRMGGRYRYIIVGGGLAGASAIKGIRGRDREGSILLLCAEPHIPYDRPPLTKKLWFGKKKLEDIYLNPSEFYEKDGVSARLGVRAVKCDATEKTLHDETGASFQYEKLLMATGGSPRILDIPGGSLEDIFYYRSIDDYTRLREKAKEGASAIVVGGGFIGSEIAAALNINKVEVTMIFPSAYLCSRVFPEALGLHIQEDFEKRGVHIFGHTTPAAIQRKGRKFVVTTTKKQSFEADILIVGAGIAPNIELARSAGIKADDGVHVNEFLQTSDPDVFAAGDCANFPYKALSKRTRVEHWDNALMQGALAGENMAGAMRPYDHMPYFFSDLFDFGYEAVGDVNSGLQTYADWQEENAKGVIYYLNENRVRGVMLCNVWDKVEDARTLIRKGEVNTPASLKGAIR